MGKTKIRFLSFLSVVSILLTANMMKGESFVVKKGNELNIIHRGDTFIKKDILSLADFSNAEFHSLGKTEEWEEVSVLKGGSKKDCIYYRETGYKPGRIEITWYIKYAPYQFGTSFLGHNYHGLGATYEMKIPVEFLDGGHYKAATGDTRKPEIKEGKLFKDRSEGEIIESCIWYITFTKNGQSISLDLNPVGPHNFGQKNMLTESDWRLTRDGKYFSLWSNMTDVKWGETQIFKITITDSKWAYDETHTRSKRGFYPYLYPTQELIFGKKNPRPSQYTLCDSSLYSKEKGFGWEDNKGIKLIETDFESSIRKDYIKGEGGKKQDFFIDAKDGLYLISLLFGSSNEESGLFNVCANNELKLKNLKTGKEDFIAKTIYAWTERGRIRLSFEGSNWMLNALSLTPLVYNEEDYIFKRSWFIQQGRFDKWLSEVEVIPTMPDIIRKKASSDKMDWTWNCAFETLEGSGESTRTALDTPESIEHRLKLIKSGGFNAAIINGLHFRYNAKDMALNNIMLRNTRLAVETAHKLGIKLIDHYDFNWVFYPGYPSMLKMLEKDPDCLQRDILNPLQVSTGFCLHSKEYMREFVDYLVEEQKKTDIDGYMLDEITWVYTQFCGCDKCRSKFYEDTGYRLPYDKDAGFFQNYDNKIWRAYVTWRGQKQAEFLGALKEEVQKVCPDVVFLQYTSDFLSSRAERGLELNKVFPWNTDYIGDEFHCKDIIQNWRVMFIRFKDRQGVASSWGNYPTWMLPSNLVHPDRILYAWAIARMNRANIWYRAGDYPFSDKLNNWQYQMKDRYARPISDVAVLLSQDTRDFKKDESYYHEEYTGWLQTLAEISIQYNVIIDRDVIFDKLKKYKVLILANTAVLSDAQAGQIKEFVLSGGSVIATYETGMFNEKGERRDGSIFQDVMNIKTMEYIPLKTKIRFIPELAGDMQQPELETDIKQCASQLIDKDKSKVLAEIIDPVKNEILAPAIVETSYGKGKFYYISGNFIKQNYEPRMASTETTIEFLKDATIYKVRFNRDLNKLVENLLNLAIGEDYKTKAVKIPDGVIYVAFDQKYEGKESILIHFLNCQGKPDRKYGDPLILIDPIPEPPLLFDVELRIKSDNKIKEAFVVSPLKDGKINAILKPEEDNCYSVTVPREAIGNYAILYLNK